MKPLRLSEEGQVTIPEELREMTGMATGTLLVAIPVGRTVVLTQAEPLSALRGIARGANATGYRDRGPG